MNKVIRGLENPKLAWNHLLRQAGFSESWAARRFAAPSPDRIKIACVLRNGLPDATWVETGTYRGDTTSKLAGVGKMVYSVEPEPTLYANAKKRFERNANVEIINGLSEQVFPGLLPNLRGDVCFWLDGHFSGGVTHKGPLDTPISKELESIAENLATMGNVVVMVDDIRLFNGKVHAYGAYPTLDELVDWARSNQMTWHIEHDIFIARNG